MCIFDDVTWTEAAEVRIKALEDKSTAAENVTALKAHVTKLEADNIALRKLVTDEIGALKAEQKKTKEALLESGALQGPVPTLSASKFTVCGVATNPTVWQEDHVGMLGTYASRKDSDNWSLDCRLSVKKAIDAGAENIVMRVYDPVDSNHMDFSWTLKASEWYAAYQHLIPDKDYGESVTLEMITKPAGAGNFVNHKIWSVGTVAEQEDIQLRVLAKLSYIQHYCNGAASNYKYSGIGTKSALSFITGNGQKVHATLCSTGLGVYGPSQCTTGSNYNCYIGGKKCTDPNKGKCTNDAAQRAAVSIKLA